MRLFPLPNGHSLQLRTADGVVGGEIWPAASVLCQYLIKRTGTPYSSLHCLKLGSGTGAAGIYAAAALKFSSMTLTEHRPPQVSVLSSVPYSVDGNLEWDEFALQKSDRLLTLLQDNVDRNAHTFSKQGVALPQALELDWNNPHHIEHVVSTRQDGCFDMILASDVTYLSQLHQPLADTIRRLLSNTTATVGSSVSHDPPYVPTCLVAHQQRILDLKGCDYQLAGFENVLQHADLEVVKCTEHDYVDDQKVSRSFAILEIQHAR